MNSKLIVVNYIIPIVLANINLYASEQYISCRHGNVEHKKHRKLIGTARLLCKLTV
jgi:hypothetical protein